VRLLHDEAADKDHTAPASQAAVVSKLSVTFARCCRWTEVRGCRRAQ